jgi:Lrp/AsnC family leucine-responsive transcriptional regulator
MFRTVVAGLALLVPLVAYAVDITGCGQVVPPRETGVLQVDLTGCSSSAIGVFLSDDADERSVENKLGQVPEIEDCWFVAGEETYVVKVRVTDVPALEQMLGTLNRIGGVARTRTTVVLSTKFEDRVQPLD